MFRYASRKFWLTVAVETTAIVGLFTHFIDQQYFLWIATLTLGMYKAASVIDTKLNGSK
jgi:hypothetical protein